MLDFLDVHILDIIDILLVAILLYNLYRVIKNSVAVNIFLGIAVLYISWEIVSFLKLDLLSTILGKFMSVGFILLIIVFQKEIRNFLTIIGTSNLKSFNKRIKQSTEFYFLNDLMEFLFNMSKNKVGVIIVIERSISLNFLIENGDSQNIKVTKSILESIFYPKGPLHDGAVIISKEGRIICTRALLPLSSNNKLSAKYGTRHRAAVGITEETDSVCLVVSEETGNVSVVENGEIFTCKNISILELILKKLTYFK